jgi:hypothetical protein
LCDTERRGDFTGVPSTLNTATTETARSNYVGNNGDLLMGGGNGDKGIFTRLRCTGFRDVTDGLSNTICIGERSSDVGTQTTRNAGLIYASPDMDQSPDSGVRSVFGNGGVAINANNANNTQGFSSLHTGGAHFLLLDGAVRFINENLSQTPGVLATDVNSGIFQRLLMPADGQVVAEF